MLFSIHCIDRDGGSAIRSATRATHLAYLDTQAASLVHVGPLLDPHGAPCGSVLVVDVSDRAAAERLAAGDPYAIAGLFETVLIHGHRVVFRDGARVA
jgi:uncharacterized protein YciI